MAHVDDGELEMLLDGALHLLPPERAEVVLRYVETEEGAERLARARAVHERSSEILSAGRPRVDELPDFAALKARAAAAAGAGADPGRGAGGLPADGGAGGASPADVLPMVPRRRGVSLLWAASLAAALGLGWMGRGLLQGPGEMGTVAMQEVGADAAAPLAGPAGEAMIPPAASEVPPSGAASSVPAGAATAVPAAPVPAAAAPQGALASAEAEESVAPPPPATTTTVVAEAAPAPVQAGRLPAALPPAAPPPAPQVADAPSQVALRRGVNPAVETTEVATGAAAPANALPGVARLREEIPAEADGVAPAPPPLLLATSPRTPPSTWPSGWAQSTPPVPGLPVLDVTTSGPYRVILQELDGGGVLEVRYGNTPSQGARAAAGLQGSPLPVDTVVPWLQGNALRLPRPGGWLELRAPVDEPTLRGWAGFLLARDSVPRR